MFFFKFIEAVSNAVRPGGRKYIINVSPNAAYGVPNLPELELTRSQRSMLWDAPTNWKGGLAARPIRTPQKGYGSDHVSLTIYKCAIVSELRRDTAIHGTIGSFSDFITKNTVSRVKFYCKFDNFYVSAIHYGQLPVKQQVPHTICEPHCACAENSK